MTLNASAAAYAWFAEAIHAEGPQVWEDWWRPAEEIVNGGTTVIWSEPWPHDLWVAQGLKQGGSAYSVVQTWEADEPLDTWPRLRASALDPVLGPELTSTGADALQSVVSTATSREYAHRDVLDLLLGWRAAARQEHWRAITDPAPLRAWFVTGWLDSVLGSSLSSVVLSPTEDDDLTLTETLRRFDIALRIGATRQDPQIDLEAAMTVLYTAAWVQGEAIPTTTTQGQSRTTGDHWRWLSHPLLGPDLLDAVQVTSGLLVSPPLLRALLSAVSEGTIRTLMGLGVLRRWALGLRALAWLESAIGHPWREVTRNDLATFAFASVAPWWPRATLAVSHRSADVKPVLAGSRLWGHHAVAIDATTVPSRETNTGLIWRLFAATPAIVRVHSALYEQSPWCRREAELTAYLRDVSDFMVGRRVADVEIGALAQLADLIPPTEDVAPNPAPPPDSPPPAFPPRTIVLDVPSYPPVVVALLAAVATLRLLHGLIENAVVVNAIAGALSRGDPLEIPPPTNHPDGWTLHYEVFGALAEHSEGDQPVVALASEYPADQLELDVEDIVNRLPDLRHTVCSAVDILAGLEWNREVRRWFADRWGNRVVVDCRGIDAQEWATEPGHGIKRSMVELDLDTLVFVLQDRGQEAHRWPVIGDQDAPLMTQHLSNQLEWLSHGFALPTWLAAYVSLPEFDLAPGVVDAAFEALAPAFNAFEGLVAPTEYSEVFAMDPTPYLAALGEIDDPAERDR